MPRCRKVFLGRVKSGDQAFISFLTGGGQDDKEITFKFQINKKYKTSIGMVQFKF